MDTLNHWNRSVIRPVAEISSTVIHELVHEQQKAFGMADDSLLFKSVREGVAVLMTELVTRREDGTAPHTYGRLHERALWEEFKEYMYHNDASNWLGNGMNSVDRPADLGYFIGCQICRSFVKRFGNNAETIARLIEVEDFEEIYGLSEYNP